MIRIKELQLYVNKNELARRSSVFKKIMNFNEDDRLKNVTFFIIVFFCDNYAFRNALLIRGQLIRLFPCLLHGQGKLYMLHFYWNFITINSTLLQD